MSDKFNDSVPVLVFAGAIIVSLILLQKNHQIYKDATTPYWQPPDSSLIPHNETGDLIRYGRNLISHTAYYLGPKGKVANISNGMNCQNCHLDAGTRIYGNNYGSVASLYPKFRERSGSKESVVKRVNDCIKRSLNGIALDSNSLEMKAIVSYITWVGSEVPKGKKAKGSGLKEISYLSRAADPKKGKPLYEQKCKICHTSTGSGISLGDTTEYNFPPLWGKNSFNTGAGLFRISNFARYIRVNMPQGATYDNPLLTQTEAWDIAAYVISKERPAGVFLSDWPKISTKPVDHPFGPFADNFTEEQHKFGPFKPIVASRSMKD